MNSLQINVDAYVDMENVYTISTYIISWVDVRKDISTNESYALAPN